MNLFAAFNSDGYKLGHAAMYAEGTSSVYSNLTPRSNRIYEKTNATSYHDGKLVLVGLQGALIEIVESWQHFFDMEKGIAIAQFKFYVDNYMGKDTISIENLAKLHDLGFLPLRVKTLTEGTKVPMGVPVLTITNTVDHAYWLVNFLETTISNLTWKPSTVATIAAEYKRMMLDYAERTGVDPATVLFQGHSFACRGMSGPEDSARSEFGHIALFLGTDSLGSIMYAQQHYSADPFVAASVPATEHAVSTSNILRIERDLRNSCYEFQNEEQREIFDKMVMALEDIRLIAEIMFLYELMLKFPTGILSYVADSFDFWALIEKGLPYMKAVILRRESNGVTPGRLVIRPDSARYSPVEVVCGLGRAWTVETLERDEILDVFMYDQKAPMILRHENTHYILRATEVAYDDMILKYELEEITSSEMVGAVEALGKVFGFSVNDKGFKVLNDHIGLIYGDSITPRRCLDILDGMADNGWASSNCVFGIGSYTYQCNTRDTFGFAVKATHTVVNGQAVNIFKDPKTDSKKKSAKGLLYVSGSSGQYELIDEVSPEVEAGGMNQLVTRFEDGEFKNLTTLEEIRARLQHG